MSQEQTPPTPDPIISIDRFLYESWQPYHDFQNILSTRANLMSIVKKFPWVRSLTFCRPEILASLLADAPIDLNHDVVFVAPHEIWADDSLRMRTLNVNFNNYRYFILSDGMVNDANNPWSTEQTGRHFRLADIQDFCYGYTVDPAHIITDMRGMNMAFLHVESKAIFHLGHDANFCSGRAGLQFVEHMLTILTEEIKPALNLPETPYKPRLTLGELEAQVESIKIYRDYYTNINKVLKNSIKAQTDQLDRDIYEMQSAIHNKDQERTKLNIYAQELDNRLSGGNLQKNLKADEMAFQNLLKNKKYKSFRIVNHDGFEGITHPIIIGGKYPMGFFKVRLSTNGSIWFEQQEKHLIMQEKYHHPHILENRPCLGNLDGNLQIMIRDFQIATSFDIIHDFLGAYNASNPYLALGRWHGKIPGLEKCNQCDDATWFCRCQPRCTNCSLNSAMCQCFKCPIAAGPLESAPGSARICRNCSFRISSSGRLGCRQLPNNGWTTSSPVITGEAVGILEENISVDVGPAPGREFVVRIT